MSNWLTEKHTDPLKLKFKKCTLKFYSAELKDNLYNATKKLHEVKAFEGITYFRYWLDYGFKNTHIHMNIVLKSTQYKKLLEKYKMKGPDKDVSCYLHMEDLNTSDQFIDWIEYCTFRERTNWYKYCESQKKLTFEDNDSSTSD